ncbi:hypothetical protein GDO78_019845 [Eleutherodactylus coqui]|uniref:Uncharacterized protein n=1 Tax=Eleutherodactylus coqui TaxID=57060 RepID=A0A8J6ECF8_ELECQ|nr:hypothetical protein GDO78_019845 [Eleutherodactylus coqui]
MVTEHLPAQQCIVLYYKLVIKYGVKLQHATEKGHTDRGGTTSRMQTSPSLHMCKIPVTFPPPLLDTWSSNCIERRFCMVLVTWLLTPLVSKCASSHPASRASLSCKFLHENEKPD